MRFVLISALMIASFGSLHAQFEEINGGPVNVPAEGVVDGVYIQEHIPTKRMIPYEFVREADVVWSRRVWSFIDLREKMNHSLYFPFDYYIDSTRWHRCPTGRVA